MCSTQPVAVARQLVVAMLRSTPQRTTCLRTPPRRPTANCASNLECTEPVASTATPLIQPSPLPGDAATPPQPRGQDHVDDSWQTLMRWSRWLRRRSEERSVLQRVAKVVVFGGGSFGTAVAAALARQKPDMVVALWLRDADVCATINEQHRNPRYLPVGLMGFVFNHRRCELGVVWTGCLFSCAVCRCCLSTNSPQSGCCLAAECGGNHRRRPSH